MGSIWQDVKLGVRTLARTPRFTAAAVLALALGIGANSAVFSLVNAVLIQRLPFESADRLTWVTSRRPDSDDGPFSLPEYLDYREQTRSFDELAAYGNLGFNLTGSGETERLQGIRASANFFDTLGARAALGRVLEPRDDDAARPRVVVLGHGLWTRRFGGDRSVLGRSLVLNGTSHEVVGVLAPEFIFPEQSAELVTPLVPDADPWRSVRSSVNFLRVIGRLRSGVSLAQAEEEMTAIAVRLREQYPVEYARDIGVRVVPWHDRLVRNYRQSLWVLLGAMGLVLLTASANLANLLLSRASARQREMAIRRALGASRIRTMVQALTEGLVLASIGGGVGLLVTTQGLPLLLEFAPRDLPRLAEVSVDGTVLAWTVAVSLLSGMLFSTAPALVTSRSDASDALKEGARGVSHARSGVYARSLLVVVEVGLATVLLVTGGLLLRSFGALQRVAPGFDAKGLLVARLSLPASRYPDRDAVNLFCETLRSRLQPLPGVEALGVVSLAPMSGLFASVDFTVDGQPPPAAEQVPVAQYRVVSPGYMRTMDIAVLEGREFTEQDIFTSRPVVLVNQTLARRFFERGMAVGSRLRVDDNDVGPRLMEIVGVVRDIKQSGLDTAPSPEIYASMPQHHPGVTVWLRNNMFWMIRTKQDPAALVEPFRAALRDVAFDVPASSIQPMDRYLSAWMAPRRFNLQLISVFAAAALLLAASGVYAVISYSVSLRTREIGIRMALGARRRTILAQVVSRGVLLSTIGVVAGLCTALALGRFLRALLFEVSPFDIGVYASMAGLLITVSCVASYLPARRAARVDPLVALRHEGWE